MEKEYCRETILAQLGNRSDEKTGAVSAPIYLSTAYGHTGINESTGYDYSRTKNPTRTLLEEAIAKLEGGVQGFACPSGMAAINLVMSLFTSPDEWIISSDVYGGTYRLLDHMFQHNHGINPRYVNTANIEEIEHAITQDTKAIFIETPSNPLMEECDIAAISHVARKHNLLLIVDNTFLTPAISRPIEHGADIVVHSASKYLSGHNDVLAGLVVTNDEALAERLFMLHNSAGAVLSPFDSWLALRGMKTLSLRMQRHQENAIEIAEFLRQHPQVEDVLYPNKGGMLSFRVKDASLIEPFLKTLKLITFAESLGGSESFITYPATQTHMDVPEEERTARGITNSLLRFSVGLEAVEDLKTDLNAALQ